MKGQCESEAEIDVNISAPKTELLAQSILAEQQSLHAFRLRVHILPTVSMDRNVLVGGAFSVGNFV